MRRYQILSKCDLVVLKFDGVCCGSKEDACKIRAQETAIPGVCANKEIATFCLKEKALLSAAVTLSYKCDGQWGPPM